MIVDDKKVGLLTVKNNGISCAYNIGYGKEIVISVNNVGELYQLQEIINDAIDSTYRPHS